MKKLPYLLLMAIAAYLLHQGLQRISSGQENLNCKVIEGSVYDGDTLRADCRGERLKIRFACIDSPEIAQKYGIASRDHLRSLLNRSGNRIAIKPVAVDRYGRTVAEVYASGHLVQLEQAKAGMVWAYERYKQDCPHWKEVEKAFLDARTKRRGIFMGGGAIPPWRWRDLNR